MFLYFFFVFPILINLSKTFSIKHEIGTQKLRLCFTATPKHNISELQTDIYNFAMNLRLTYHFHYSNYEDKSIVKNVSTFTLKTNKNKEIETICKTLLKNKS